jgi:hypothetical protein
MWSRLGWLFEGSLHLARSIPERGPNCWLHLTSSPSIANAMADDQTREYDDKVWFIDETDGQDI